MKALDRYFVDDVTCALRGRSHRVANLSLGGFFTATDEPPRPGEILPMELFLPSRWPCRVLGQVAWINGAVERSVADLPPGFGVAATWVGPQDLEQVAALLKQSSPVLRPSSPSLSSDF